MAKESKSANEVSPEQINQWIKEHQENKNTDAQDKLVKHYQKLIESLAYKYSKGQSHHEDLSSSWYGWFNRCHKIDRYVL
ncbi:hypothetical protein ACVXZ0_05650 [Staphylococcus aureus]